LSFHVGEYLRGLGAIPLPVDVPSEETAPDFSVGVTMGDAEHLGDIQVPEVATTEVIWKFFIDGVQQTVPVCLIPIGNLRIPVYIAHLIAGATQRVNSRLVPFIKREAIILYFPLEGLRSVSTNLPNPLILNTPPFPKLDRTGNIYEKIKNAEHRIEVSFWTDISVKLSQRQGEEVDLDPSQLSAIGAIRKAARDRSRVLLRIMELGIIWEIARQNILKENEFMIIDGPVFLPFKYATLASQRLANLMDSTGEQIGDSSNLYSLLCHLLGAVKSVEVIPTQGLASALSSGPNFVIPIYLFSTTVKGARDEVSRHTLACFVWLRREVCREISPIWSPASELTRLDIPFPAIVDPKVDDKWYTSDFRPNIQQGNHRQKLEAILKTIVAERWPVPETFPHRMLTELYPIAETERWLKANLLSEQELRRLAGV